jgi:hypothetical protein
MRNWQIGDDAEADARSAVLLESAISILTRKEVSIMANPNRVKVVSVKPARKPAAKPAPKGVAYPDEAFAAFSAASFPKENENPDEHSEEGIDNDPPEGIKSGFSVFNPVSRKDITMARHPKHQAAVAEHAPAHTPETVVNEDGYTETINPIPVREPTKQEIKAAEAKAKIEAKAAKKTEAEAKKAEREAAKAAKVTSTVEERAARKAEREARLAALNPDGTRKYVGSMLALADRVKQGAYVKGATGQLRSTNELAEVLDAVPVDNVIKLAKQVLGLDHNPYVNLNTGQQSMNLRNKMRGAIKKGTLTIATIRETIEAEGYATATDWAAERAAKKAAREARAAEAKAAKSARDAEKAAKKAEDEKVAAGEAAVA